MKNIKLFFKALTLLAISTALCACSTPRMLKSRDNLYLQSKTAPLLQTPAGVSSQQFGQDYPVAGTVNYNGQAPSLAP